MRRILIAVVAAVLGITFGLPGPVSAGGASATVAVEPDVIDFGQVVVGTTSESQDVTLTNNGSSEAQVQGLLSGGEPGDLDGETGGIEISASTCFGEESIELPPGESCSFSFVFTPTHTGAHSPVVIDWVQLDVGGTPAGTTTLSGAGVEPAPCGSPSGPLSGPLHGLLGPIGLGSVSTLVCDLGL